MPLTDLVLAKIPERIAVVVKLPFPIEKRVSLSKYLEERFGIEVSEHLAVKSVSVHTYAYGLAPVIFPPNYDRQEHSPWLYAPWFGHAYFEWGKDRVRLEMRSMSLFEFHKDRWQKLIDECESFNVQQWV